MAEFRSTDEAREFFKNDRFAVENGMQIDELGEEYCRVSMKLTEHHQNAVGGIMGGVTFTLADFAFAVLQNHMHKPSVAQQVSINFLAPPKGEHLYAEAHLRRNGRTSTIVNVDVTDEEGRDIAQFIGTGYKLQSKNG